MKSIEDITNISHRQDAMASVMFVRYTIGGVPVGLVLVFAATRCGPSRRNNVEIIDLYVEIEKSQNVLFERPYILIYLATF